MRLDENSFLTYTSSNIAENLPTTEYKRADTMVMRDVRADKQARDSESEQECFLCILDPQPCSIKKLEGYIIHAQEVRSDGETVPFITINLGTELAALTLTRYYRSLAQGLIELGPDLHKRKLMMRVYHLPPS